MSEKSEIRNARGESFRVPIDCAIDVRLDNEAGWKRRFATNISMSGIFVRSAEMHPKGTFLDIRFELQNGRPAIQGRAEVLWCRVRDGGPERPQGLGLRFIELDLESKYAISRLVERYRQMGRMPFHINASEEAKTGPAQRGRGALVLAFFAGAAVGVLGSLLWMTGPNGLDGRQGGTAEASELRSKGSRSVPGATPEAVAERASSFDPSGDPASGDPASGDPASGDPASGDPASGDPASGDPASSDPAAVEAAVVNWAEAWADKDVERYLECYSADFRPASGRSLDAWRSQRRERLARPGAVEIRLSGLEVEVPAAGRATARFDQDYSAPGYRDRVRKALELSWSDQGWRIEREEIEAELTAE